MIGSCTMIVKSQGKYDLHIFGGGLGFAIRLREYRDAKISPYTCIDKAVKEWESADKSNLTSEEVIEVADATNCCKENKGKSGYSEFAGDGVYLLDLDESTFSRRDSENKCWVKL